MLFNSYPFLFLFLPSVLSLFLILPRGFRLPLVVLSSYVFYGLVGQAWFLLPMLFSSLLDFQLARAMQPLKGPGRSSLLLCSLFFNLGLLALFKYSVVAAASVHALGWGIQVPAWLARLAFPAGISFYTFQSVTYMLDVYWGKTEAEQSLLRYAGFIAFFPHLVAGPLTRHGQLAPQLAAMDQGGNPPSDVSMGVFLIASGLIKKVILGDGLARYVDALLAWRGLPWGCATAWLMLLGFTFQIYFDFSGYSEMAMGIAHLFGVRLPVNFDSPYRSSSLKDFWRRWHISLSQGMRDYVYIPLGGARQSAAGRDMALMLLFAVSGLWHGAGWNFLAWGLWHGGALVVEKRRGKASGALATFIVVMLGWVIFRCNQWDEIRNWMLALAGIQGLGLAHYFSRQQEFDALALLCCVSGALAFFAPESWRLDPRHASFRWAWPALAVLTVWALMLLSGPTTFYYFRF